MSNQNIRAFSILEVIIAISIMAVGMLGVSSLMIQNLQAESIDRDLLVASMLAQEGIELVRNQRDLNWLTPGALWYEKVVRDDDHVNNDFYSIDYYPPSEIFSINDTPTDIDHADARLEIDNYGYYAHNIGGIDTEFFRLIEVDSSNLSGGDGYLIVTCTVRFRRLNQVKDYITVTRLHPWRY